MLIVVLALDNDLIRQNCWLTILFGVNPYDVDEVVSAVSYIPPVFAAAKNVPCIFK